MSDFSKLKKLAEDYIRLIDDPDEDLWAEARDMYDDASDADTVLALIKENESLRAALKDAEYRADQGKVWNGMGWTYTGLSAHGQQKVLDILRAAISSPENP
jgi:hypothetical protein